MMFEVTVILEKLLSKKNLDKDEATCMMQACMEGKLSNVQMSALLVALRSKGETVEEITACVEVMRKKATSIAVKKNLILDTCGTGGDSSGTFNISTTVALLLASGGYYIAKHGNRSMTSKSGSADVLEALGIYLDLTPQQVVQCIYEVGIGFLFAPKLHLAMKHVMPVRKELKVRTVFNLLGPLTNPAQANIQIIGLFHPYWVPKIILVLKQLGTRSAFVFSALNGMDEVSLEGITKVARLYSNGDIEEFDFLATDYGFTTCSLEEIQGGTPLENAMLTKSILSGQESGPKSEIVILNAGFAIAAIEECSLKDGFIKARNLLQSKKGILTLEKLIQFSNQFKI